MVETIEIAAPDGFAEAYLARRASSELRALLDLELR
jgi:hypothetical protein